MKKIIISAFIWTVFCFASADALAHPAHPRQVQALVQSIDHQKQILMLAQPPGRGPQKLIWNTDTQFLRDGKPVPARELKAGTQVTVYYHSPLFGKPLVTKVVWSTAEDKDDR